MKLSVYDLEEWFKRGKEEEATHMIVVCDTFDGDYYPVYVKPEEDPVFIIDKYRHSDMQRIMEVYSYKKSFSAQCKGGERAWNV